MENQRRSALLTWIMALAIPANVFVIITVNYWIYHVRAVFIATHPAYVAVQPPTISRSIADPAIGEPFAFWITLSAVLLAFGVFGIVLAYLRIARDLIPGRGRVVFQAMALGLLMAQVSSSVGMHVLSSYRFPDNNATHMVGSYLFFVAQALVIVFGVILCTMVLNSRATMDGLERAGLMRRPLVLWRRRLGFVSIALSVAYMALFLAKGMAFAVGNAALYSAYVLIEPVVISSFLLFLGMFLPDLWAMLRSAPRA